MEEKEQKNRDIKFYIILAIAVIVCILLRVFVLDWMLISGDSMLPTLQDGELILAEKISRYTDSICNGDIVIVKYPDGMQCVKRVIGMEGDTIEIQNSVLILNEKEVQEAYINEKMIQDMDIITVKENTIFVMGDNRNYSSDSRNPDIGLIPLDHIKGKVRFTVFPLNSLRTIK